MKSATQTGQETGVLGTSPGGGLVLKRVLVRVASGPERGVEKMLEHGSLIIGSGSSADLRITERTISRAHAELALLSEGVRVRDLGSTNGTFLGDSRIDSVLVRPPAEIRVGRARIELLAADVPAPDMVSERTRFGHLVGESRAMRAVFAVLERVASSDTPVLIEGETGTGKTTAALSLHEASPRAQGPLVTLEAAGGIERFEIPAAFARAAGGTIVIERIDDAPARIVDEIVISLEKRERGELDVRPLTTSRADLRERVSAGALRRDVFFHLCGVRIVLPTLSERLEDLVVLVRDISASVVPGGVTLSGAELGQLLSGVVLDGNVRGLRRLVERALAMDAARADAPSPSPNAAPVVPAADALVDLPFKDAKEKLLDAFERQYVAALLDRHDGNVSRAASEAGIARQHLAALAKKHGIR